MRASKFKKFKQSLRKHICDFCNEADKEPDEEEFELPIHRYSAAKILAWIIYKTGVILRNNQLVEAWRAIVRQCWSLLDFDSFEANNSVILHEVKWVIKNHTPKFN